MRLSIWVISGTAEALDSLVQLAGRAAPVWSSLGERLPDFEQIGELLVCCSILHPLAGGRRTPLRGSYDSRAGIFYAQVQIDYVAWAVEGWPARVEAFVAALKESLKRIAKTRISESERMRLLELAEPLGRALCADPPDHLVPVGPVYLTDPGGKGLPSVAFDIPRDPEGWTAVPASDAGELRARPDKERLFKLYRCRNGGLEYFEAWTGDRGVIEHTGRCGERGQIREHSSSDEEGQLAILRRLKSEARATGYRAIAPSRHAQLVVERALDGLTAKQALQQRHALEDFLNELTGWLGFGHCDGGSTGSGSLEVFCQVVDARVATVVIEEALAESGFGDWRVRRAEYRR